MAPFAVCAILAVAGRSGLATPAAALWGGAIIAFLAGVRRGASFRQPGGPQPRQLVVMAAHFSVAVVALALVFAGLAGVAAGLLALAFASLGLADLLGAKAGSMPLFFARLRPPQAAFATVSLAVVALLA